jgi:hypothetical protein
MPNASVSGSIDPIATTPGISASPDQEAGALAIPDVMKRSAWPAMGAGKFICAMPILIAPTQRFIRVNHTTAEAIESMTGAATQIDMAIHWIPRLIRIANGDCSTMRCFAVLAARTTSFQKNRIYNGKA